MTITHAEEYEFRRVLCISGGGIGGILGGILGSVLAPEIGIPAALATGAGSFLGGLGGGAATGEPLGQAALGALPGAVISGGVAGLGDLASTGDFLSTSSPIGNLIGGVDAAGAGTAGTPATGTALSAGTAGTAGAAPTATPAPAANAVPPGGVSGAGASAASAALPGGGIPVSGDLLGPGTTAPAAGGGAYGSYGLTDVGAPQNIGPGTIGGGDASGVGTPSAGSFDPSTVPAGNQDFSGGATGTGTGLDSIVSKLTSNPSLLLGAGALGLDALKQNQPLPEQTQLNKIGAQAEATGNQLSSYVSSGTLPPGAQESINLATTAAKSQVRSTAAQLGLSGSTWEADRMAQIDQQASAQGEQFAQQLLQQGANYTQLSTGVFENLMKSTLQQDQAFQQALAQFAGGLAGAKTGTG